MNLRAGWTPRILGVVLALAAAWFVVAHADGFLPAIGQVAGLGPAALPIGLAIVAVGVLTRALQAHASFRLVELPARFGSMLNLSATSYATNKVVKSAGTAGLVPYLAHADRAGQSRAQVAAAYLSAKLAETMSLCCLIGVAVVAGAATGGLHGSALWGAVASAAYAVVVGAALDPDRRPPVAWSKPSRTGRGGRRSTSATGSVVRTPSPAAPAPATSSPVRWIACGPTPVPPIPLLATAFAGKLLGCAGLFMVLAGLGVHLGVATTLLVYTLTLMASLVGPTPGWRRRRRRLAGRLAHRQRRRRADRPRRPCWPSGCSTSGSRSSWVPPPAPASTGATAPPPQRRSCSSLRSWSASCRSRP